MNHERERSGEGTPFAGTIELTSFAIARQFSPETKGTRITSHTPEAFVVEFQKRAADPVRVADGYADFCKIIFVENFTNARLGDVAITAENSGNMRTGYVARREGELPVLTRWLEGITAPKAAYLGAVVYDKAQLQKEYESGPKDGETPPNTDWGVVLIMATDTPEEVPMNPATMLRNSLGVAEGGSGVPLDREAYLRSVKYWETHAIISSST
jgi:hypothetical protein